MKKQGFIRLASLTLITLSAFLLTACFQKEAAENSEPASAHLTEAESKPLLIGHRGFSSCYPESTREAFIGAFEKGFDGIECDIWEADNGDLMIHHDAATTRMTGIEDFIWHVNTENRYEYPVTSGNNIEAFSNRTVLIPTLQEVLKIRNDYKGYLYLHIKAKDSYGYHLSDGGVSKIVKLISDSGLEENTFVFASKSVIKRFSGKGLNLGIITGETQRKDLHKTISLCDKYNIKTLVIWKMEAIRARGNGSDLVSYCHKRGMKIGVYETVTREDLGYLSSAGCDFAMSDYKLR